MTALFATVLEMSFKAIPVILILFIARFLLQKAPKKYSYALWAVAVFRLLCPVSVSSVFSLFNLPVSRVKEQTVIMTQGETVSAAAPAVPGGTVSVTPQYSTTVTEPTATAVNWDEVMSVVWIIGVFFALLAVGVQLFKLWNKTRFAVRAEGNVWQCEHIPGPFVFGLLRPRIFLPVWLDGADRDYVLSHERYHLKRRDNWVKALCQIILAVHWFNPFVWLMMWAVDRDMELSCDEGALKTLGQEHCQDYSRTLLALAASRREFAPVLAFGTPAVKKRIVNVLRYHKATKFTIVFAVAVLLIACLTCCTDAKSQNETATESYAEALYDARVTYVGDNSGVGNLICKVMVDSECTFDTMELYTNEEPYGLFLDLILPDWWNYTLEDHFAVDEEAFRLSVLMLALVQNLDYCEQEYHLLTETGVVDYAQVFPYMSVAQAETLLGIGNLKSYAESPEKIEELLTLIDQVDVQTAKYALAEAAQGEPKKASYFQYDGDLDLTLCLYEDGTYTLLNDKGEYGETFFGAWEQQDDLLTLSIAGSESKLYFNFVSASAQELRFQKEMCDMNGWEIYEMLPQDARFVLVSGMDEQIHQDTDVGVMGSSNGDIHATGGFTRYDMVDPQLDDVTIFAPQVVLYENGESYISGVENDAIGHYSEEDGLITMQDERNDRVYYFRRIDSTTIEFMAEGSDEIVQYSENDYLYAPIVDGTRFSTSAVGVTVSIGHATINQPDYQITSDGMMYQVEGFDADALAGMRTGSDEISELYFAAPRFLGGYFAQAEIEGSAKWTDNSKKTICVSFTQSDGTASATIEGPYTCFKVDLNSGTVTVTESTTVNGQSIELTRQEMLDAGYHLASLLMAVEEYHAQAAQE